MRTAVRRCLSLACCLRAAVLLAFALAPALATASTSQTTPQRTPSLSFAENLGQWTADIDYCGTVPGATVAFNASGVTCWLSRGDSSLSIRTSFPGAAPRVVPNGEAQATHVSHYYLGNDPGRWRTDVRNFDAVRYANLYPGIDVVYHGNAGQLEYDFHVAAGADWRRIRVNYSGTEGIAVTRAGDLAVSTRFGRVIEQAPAAWQVVDGARHPVAVRYRKVARNTFGFEVAGTLDPRASLVIDPVLHYGTYLGGGSYDEPHGIDYDAAGEAWVVGGTRSPDFPATGSPVPSTKYSVFVTRLAANGQSQLWSVFLGGSEDQIGYAIDLDANGNAFISGITGSNDFPTTAGCYDASFNGSNPGQTDQFVAKLSPSGTLLYSTYLGGSDSESNTAIALGPGAQVYVCGDAGNNYPTTPGCYDATANGASDVVLSVLTLNGLGPADLVYSTYLGGNDYDESHGLAIDGAGNAYVSGASRSANFPSTAGPVFNGSFDAFLAEIQPAGSGPADLWYCQKYGGSGQDYGGAVAVDFIAVAMTGITTSTNFPVTSGAFQTTYGGGPDDGFVMMLLPSSNYTFYSTYLGGANSDRPGAMHMSPVGVATVSGATNSPGFPTTAGAYDPSYNGGLDMFLAQFDFSGANLLEGTFIGGSQDDVPYDFKVDLIGRRYLAGTTNSTDFPTTAGAFDTNFNGGAIDGVVLKFQPQHPEACAACTSAPDTCCERAPRFQGAEAAPSLSPHLLVGTRERSATSPYVVTVFDLGSPAPTEDVEWSTMTRYNGPGSGWRADSLGSVFGLTLDEYGNIFVTHASCYDIDQLGTLVGGGPGAIYRIDAVTGQMKTFCRLPNYPDPIVPAGENLPGLGNITYDCTHQQFFVTNLEDGRIYRIKPNGVNGTTGTIQQTFDPFAQDLGPTNYLAPLNSVPSPGWAPLGERLWGVQWHANRVYYGVWAEDISAPSAANSNEIRSVGLNAAGAFVSTSDQHELFLPSMPSVDYSMPVSDISFDAGGKMLIAERGIQDTTFTSPHMARNLEYRCEAGCWIPANAYQLGVCCIGANAGGGVDYDNFPYTGGPIGRVWGSAEAIHLGYASGAEIFGYQGSRPVGGSNVTGIIIDDDGNTLLLDKTVIGDVEAPGCGTSTEGKVCGRKFSDLNHNGVQDGGEPALLGWPIVLNGPGGPYQAYTDEQGNYCFDFLPPGNYTLSETSLPGWIQTAPPGGAFTFTLMGGQTLGGRDFGNYACASAPPCVPPPPSMSAWWPFDESGGVRAAADAAHPEPARNVLRLVGGAGFVAGIAGNALHCGAATDFAMVPASSQLDLDAGDGSLAIDAWLNVNAGAQTPRMVAEKRTLVSASPYRTQGWALYLDGMQCALELGTGTVTETFAGPALAAGSWTHIAVSVDRTTGIGTWTVNGNPMPPLSFSAPLGPLSNSAALYVGQRSPLFGPGAAFDGLIDELEYFHNSPLRPASAAAIATAPAGKCKEHARVPAVTSICKDALTVTICANIVNQTNAPQNYHWSIAGLPSGPGCSVNGPTSFSPAAGTVTVPAGGTSAPICITMARPAGLTAQNATACFEFAFVNDQSGVCRSATGKIRADNSCWCVTPTQPGVVAVGQRFAPGVIGVPIGIGIKHPCDPIDLINYRVSAVYENAPHPDPLAVSLNGLLPGEAVTGSIQLDTNGESEVTVMVRFPGGYDPAGRYQIVMEADTDHDGAMEIVSSTPIASSYEADPLLEVPAPAMEPDAIRLVATPNPFQTGAAIAFTLPLPSRVDLAVFDLGGRLVRSLAHGRRTAGPQNVQWDGADDSGHEAAGGIYFVRLVAGDARLQAKVVKLR